MTQMPWWQRICAVFHYKQAYRPMTEEKDPIHGDQNQESDQTATDTGEQQINPDHTGEKQSPDQEGIDDLKDKYLRLFAEFDNYKKRIVRERLDLMKTASQDIMTALLPILDDFDRAKKNAEDQGRAEDPVIEGLFLVYHKLYALLKQKGLEEMASTGNPFDAELHEAITEIPSPTPDQKGTVIDTVEKGFKLNDKIIRYAKVVVGA
jgi:molecular chaperone GrpE